MRHTLKTGISFGLTSGIITTLGLMVGLHSSTHSKPLIIGAILIIAIADAFSDALGIHISEESENKHSKKEIWEATVSTFVAKFVIALTFIVPILLFKLSAAIIVSLIWGLSLLSIFSFYIAQKQKTNPWIIVGEHLLIVVVVIYFTHFVGDWVGLKFN